nr:hypothetical protein [uncultured Methanoregula sp.]
MNKEKTSVRESIVVRTRDLIDAETVVLIRNQYRSVPDECECGTISPQERSRGIGDYHSYPGKNPCMAVRPLAGSGSIGVLILIGKNFNLLDMEEQRDIAGMHAAGRGAAITGGQDKTAVAQVTPR